MTYDISIAFDKAKYLDQQVYLFVDTLKDNIPDDTILHVITNRGKDDSVRKYIKENINSKFYFKKPFTDLKSRCQYMFHCFEVKTEKPWLVKLELDMITLKHLDELNKLMNDDIDISIGTECRRMIDNDVMETRIWRSIYRALEVQMPKNKVTFTEDRKEGLPLYDTSLILVKSKWLDYINEHWHDMIKICENWIQYNIHPNEFAFTALIHKADMKCKLFNSSIYDFNPISHFRKGEFPSQELIDNPIIPEDVVMLQYHRPWWLKKLCESNPKLNKIVSGNVDEKWLNSDVDISQFVEKS